jgi:hypothetical protein
VLLIVRDNLGLSDDQRTNITVPYETAHVGDLDGTSAAQQNVWNATVTITVHDSRHAVVSNALVTGLWNDGTSGTCTTNADGQCAAIRSAIPRKTTSVSFSVTNVRRPAFEYKSEDNHDRQQQRDRDPRRQTIGASSRKNADRTGRRQVTSTSLLHTHL